MISSILYHARYYQTTGSPTTFWPRAPRISQINRTIGERVFGPFPKVAHPLHEKSAKDGALCKRDKKEAGNLSVSGFFWSKRRDSNPRPFGPEPNALPNCATPRYCGANKGTRTLDLWFTKPLLYRLSYIGRPINSRLYHRRAHLAIAFYFGVKFIRSHSQAALRRRLRLL